MSLFAAATARTTKSATKTNKKKTIWEVDETSPIAASVRAFVECDREKKAAEAKLEPHKRKLREFGNTNYVRDYVDNGFAPESPMVIQTPDGESVTFVVQDRTGDKEVTEDMRIAVEAVLGTDAAERLIYQETTFKLNRDLLAIPGVAEVVEKALMGAITKLSKENILEPEQAELLVEAETKNSFRPGILKSLTTVCGSDVTRVTNFLEAMGTSCTRYVRS